MTKYVSFLCTLPISAEGHSGNKCSKNCSGDFKCVSVNENCKGKLIFRYCSCALSKKPNCDEYFHAMHPES